ncbi:uncharacterized protein Z519_02167 [Cladophialophora bantiana CBS 173.52]|uniref:CENP-V/GFA domain-containing protein n=1 Tax=Cladophialophora bantiana (strain ATCC 10958 / CBS 173.52 / CDC B-1940 / NIH 8579) TaxID=1442370 RepID=A0A0D2F3E3_CLAB1|nr:uncharacterized protein Z519_02167 [Cladophialophora bantiana CBS 173.52]KIW96776.1 hypothetical protein Z519_02167 [Cladophialophora bantiana CBS 173.52]
MESSPNHPAHISGGCLCGAIRYHVTLDEWPPNCRKWTGALMTHILPLPDFAFTWTPSDRPTYREYNSSPGCYRGFCNVCGGNLTWRGDSYGGRQLIILSLGSVDPAWLLSTAKSNFGTVLCSPRGGNYFWENAILGVTDRPMAGEKLLGSGDDSALETAKYDDKTPILA